MSFKDEELLSFPIDMDATLKHLRQDMRDDWFYDAVKYEDLLSSKKDLMEVLTANLDENHGEYAAGKKQLYDVPKRALGLRYSLEIDFYDRFLYQAICTYLIPYFDPLLSKRVLSHRHNKFSKNKKYLFKNRIELWNTFENISHLAIHDNKSLLVTDLLNYFEQIKIEDVEKAFVGMIHLINASGAEKNTIRNAISTLKALLTKWCYSDLHGLPQNRDASSFIANVVLNAVDIKMAEKGYDYYRYVDDIRFICNDEMQARRALNDLIYELRKFGLNINSKKTAILDSQSKEIEEFFPSKNDSMTLIDTMWRSRSKKVIARSIPVLHQLLIEQLESQETQSRPFRYCINRFKTLLSSNLFDSKSVLAGEIADALIGELPKQAVSTDQFCKLMMDLELSENQLSKITNYLVDFDQAIHGWQNYHLLLLLAFKKYYSDDVVSFCESLIKESIQKSEVPACFIYLASIGKEEIVESFIDDFKSTWPYQHQRYFLIALQNSSKTKLKPLVGEMDFRLQGTIKRLKGNRMFKNTTTYIRDFSASSILDIYDELSPYE